MLRPGHLGLSRTDFFLLNLAKISVLQALAIIRAILSAAGLFAAASDHPALRAAISDPFRQPP